MEKLAMKGMESKDSGSSDAAADREVRLFVRGYDTSLPEDDARSALNKHFSSFGKFSDAIFITGMAMVYLRGGPSIEKVENLNGGCECDVEGGCKIVVDQLVSLYKPRKCPIPGPFFVMPDFYVQRAMKLAAKNAKDANNAKNDKDANKAKKAKRAKTSKNAMDAKNGKRANSVNNANKAKKAKK